MRPFRFTSSARFLLLAAILISVALPAAAQSTDAAVAKVVSLMKANNYNFQTTRSPTVWVVRLTGTHLKDVKVVLAIGTDADPSLVIFVTVVEKRRMPVNTDFMRTLLEQNHVMDRVKIAFDKDGDLEVRSDSKLRLADATEFQEIVTQVKNASDELYGLIEPQLLP